MRSTIAVAFVVALSFVGGGCTAEQSRPTSGSPALVADGSPIRLVLEAPGTNQYVSFVAGELCLSTAGEVEITAVEPVDPAGGFEVTDFTVLAAGGSMVSGAENARLDDVADYAGGSRRVATTCGDGTGATLVIEAHKPGVEAATAQAFKAAYRSGGGTRHVKIEWAQMLCNERLESPACAF